MKRYRFDFPRERRLASCSIPLFHAVPGRARADGWTPKRQAQFIGHLAETRSVTEAARRVNMARETAYRLRAREWSESFRAAWDAALGERAGEPARKVTSESHGERSQGPIAASRKTTDAELFWRVDTGLWHIELGGGRFLAAWPKPDESALSRLLKRRGGRVPSPPAEGSAT